MSVIFYSLAGEGLGHATRSQVVISWLTKQNHSVVIFSYDRAYQFMKKRFKKNKKVLEVVEITGINATYEKNELQVRKTILNGSSRVRKMISENLKIITNKTIKYSPSLAIIDFEPTVYSIAKLLKIPIICIDNQGFMSKCVLDKPLSNLVQVRFFDYSHIFDGDYNFITTVFNAKIKSKYRARSCLVGPIVRDIFDKRKARNGEHLLVYQTSTSNQELFKFLGRSNERYIIYGFGKEEKNKNLHFKKMKNSTFVKDFLSCKAIIANGGFSLMSEAICLKKPIYSIPVKRITEQKVNGYYLQKLGYGVCSEEVNEKDLKKFLDNLDYYRENIKKNPFRKNDVLKLLGPKIGELEKKSRKYNRAKILSKLLKDYKKIILRIKNLRFYSEK